MESGTVEALCKMLQLTRWALYFQQFNMHITYRAGTTNQSTEGLSRQNWEEEMDQGEEVKEKIRKKLMRLPTLEKWEGVRVFS